MVFDLHIHTNRYSGCSNIDPIEAVRKAARLGLDGIGFTEHGIRWKDEEIKELMEKSGVESLIIFPGQEVACYTMRGEFQGEFLVYGYPDSLGSNKSVEIVLELVHGSGGVVIAAHPFKPADSGYGFYGSGHALAGYEVDGLEVEHPDYDENGRKLAYELMLKKKLAGIGCSDAHDVRNIGICRTVFEERVDDIPGLCAAIRAGRVRAENKMKSSINGKYDR
jgi:hypothetical protein